VETFIISNINDFDPEKSSSLISTYDESAYFTIGTLEKG
jgi:hypothetical protein